jgi:hypothetical protein
MPGENVGLGWCQHVYCLIDLPGCGFVGSWDGIVSSDFECLYGLGTALLVMCLHRPPPLLPIPTPILCLIPTSLNPKTLPLPLPATALYLRLSVSGVHCIQHRGPLCGVRPRVGTPKPTSPLQRRRHYLATLRILGPERYADRLVVASGPARMNLGRFGCVSFKGSWSKDHSRGPPTLG